MSLPDLVALNASGRVGQALYRRLLARFGTIRNILTADQRDLLQVNGVGRATAGAIVGARNMGEPELDRAKRAGVSILTLEDAAYPPTLRTLYDHPLVLYIRGPLTDRDVLAVGIVGSRKATPYGRRQADRFGCDLARLGVTVVSGLARGIDTIAHQGAVKTEGGRTIAVLGSGLGALYPPENESLAARIADNGAVISEFPMDCRPEPTHFPRRNRIIAGLSQGILVVEADERSGALITADWAVEAGRDVFCIPGSIENPYSRGCHLLIRQGARLVEEAADILEEIPALAALLGERPSTLGPVERTLFRHLGTEARTNDRLAGRARLPDALVEKTLAEMEEKGAAVRKGDGWVRGPLRND